MGSVQICLYIQEGGDFPLQVLHTGFRNIDFLELLFHSNKGIIDLSICFWLDGVNLWNTERL